MQYELCILHYRSRGTSCKTTFFFNTISCLYLFKVQYVVVIYIYLHIMTSQMLGCHKIDPGYYQSKYSSNTLLDWQLLDSGQGTPSEALASSSEHKSKQIFRELYESLRSTYVDHFQKYLLSIYQYLRRL